MRNPLSSSLATLQNATVKFSQMLSNRDKEDENEGGVTQSKILGIKEIFYFFIFVLAKKVGWRDQF